jgi:hypothetical protein
MELTMRSPYKTFFKNFIGFQRIYINTIKGLMCVSNRTPSVMYLLPAGEIRVTQMVRGNINIIQVRVITLILAVLANLCKLEDMY